MKVVLAGFTLAAFLSGAPVTTGAPVTPPLASGAARAASDDGPAPTNLLIDGPPAPVAPAVINRDEKGRITIRAIRLKEPLTIDGRLDDRIYEEVPSIADFVQQEPAEGEPETERTEAWIFFDDNNVYVSFRCWDDHPERMVVNELRHDNGGVFSNEHMTVVFDTFYDRRAGFLFQANPLGARRDQQIADERTANIDWNPVWDAKGARNDHGYTLEMVIPFKSMRYKTSGPQVWAVNFRRAIRWKGEWTYLSAVPRSYGSRGVYKFSSAASLVGIEVPKQKNLEVKPYAISSLNTDKVARPVQDNKPDGNLGFDAKYGLTRGLIADFTYNTDFAQVEEDQQQVNLTRFSLLFPEKRDFFLEGQGIFSFGPGSSLAPIVFFSRRIGLSGTKEVPIEVGTRVTGRAGLYTVGALNIQTKDSVSANAVATNFSTVRIKRNFLRRSSIGMLGTSRSRLLPGEGEGSNQVFGADTSLSFFDNVEMNAYYVRSRTPRVSGDTSSYLADASWEPDRYGLSVSSLSVGDGFNPEVGFLSRTAFRRSYAHARFSPRPLAARKSIVRKYTYETGLEYITDVRGRLESRTGNVGFTAEFNNGDIWSADYNKNYELLKEVFKIATGVVIPVGGYPFENASTSYNFGPQRKISGSANASYGAFYDGHKTSAGASGRMDLISRISLEPRVAYNWVDLREGRFTTRLVSARVTYMFTTRAQVSTFLQYNSSSNAMSSSVRLRWEYIPGSDFFIAYSDGRDTTGTGFPTLQNRSFVVKITRLVRF